MSIRNASTLIRKNFGRHSLTENQSLSVIEWNRKEGTNIALILTRHCHINHGDTEKDLPSEISMFCVSPWFKGKHLENVIRLKKANQSKGWGAKLLA
jgi:hypothetical protein